MENMLARLDALKKPTKSELRIISYIKENPIEMIRLNLTQLAQEAGSSNSAVIRLCQKLGYQGFSEFKFDMSRFILSNQFADNSDADRMTDARSRTDAIISKYVTYINKLRVELDVDRMTDLAKRICAARHIVLIGYNRTGLSAQQCSMRLSKIGVPNKFIPGDVALMNDYASILGKEDLTIIFSITGADMYAPAAAQLKSSDSPLFLITMNPKTPLNKYATDAILLPRISRTGDLSFLDDQALFFLFVELLISEVANLMEPSLKGL